MPNRKPRTEVARALDRTKRTACAGSAAHVIGRIAIAQDVDGLVLLLQRIDDGTEVACLVGNIGRDHVSRRADRDAVCRIVVRAVGKALPARHRLGITVFGPERRGRPARGEILDEIDETAHELLVVVVQASREIEIAIGLQRAHRTGRHAELAGHARVLVEGVPTSSTSAASSTVPRRTKEPKRGWMRLR